MNNDVCFEIAVKEGSEYQAREFYWTPNDWTTEPGANCPPLIPANSRLIKTLPPSEFSVFEQELPPLQGDIETWNETYLEVTNGYEDNRCFLLLPGILSTIASIVGVPGLLWLTFTGLEYGQFWIFALCTVFMIPTMCYMSCSSFTIMFFSPEAEPVRFCRKDKKIYVYRARRWRRLGMDIYSRGKPEIKVYDWCQVRAEVVQRLVSAGGSSRQDVFILELAVLNVETQEVIERFQVGHNDWFSNFSKRIFLWESIRRYMEEGTQRLPQPCLQVHRGTLVDCIEEWNPFSIPAQFKPGLPRAFGYFLAGLFLVASLLLAFLVLSRWIICKIGTKVNWGELEHTAFLVEAGDPALQRPVRLEDAAPRQWEAELKRRRQATWMYGGALLAQIAGLWWFFNSPSY